MLRFLRNVPVEYRQPEPAVVPAIPSAQLCALYRDARSGGDFYDFLDVQGRILILLSDVSGKREQALPIAADVQDCFREEGRKLFSAFPLNESERITELTLLLNRRVLQAAGGVRHCPAFLASYSPETGTLTYVNAGHTPALVRDHEGVCALEASGLPLGLFSHAIHDAQFCVLQAGASLLLVSRGVIETRRRGKEFGLVRLKNALQHAASRDARQLCDEIQSAIRKFGGTPIAENDLTAIALVREKALAKGMSGA